MGQVHDLDTSEEAVSNYQYKVLHYRGLYETTLGKFEDDLNRLGAEGYWIVDVARYWDYIEVCEGNEYNIVYTLCRIAR